ncbi:FdhF/YdeP family oxidoreductase [Larsenimonas suaedae]|uniref:FdhF/YdeP family oxidoreductase n=1 Tax=Larsenimonas suaedae TaxID=1851019 RepID=A0ABU1GWT1_9GAMM|nr:FdhF/YdeP family oxidoreductase [Larsenimonas suaedae]MCM2973073.1 FdhF/YdeP family oxidoreductase [Larsenimonas suaedae]MDR5896510.1 FdhF/YdeP family oxidoreductase [Larsenimonas suaedae]
MDETSTTFSNDLHGTQDHASSPGGGWLALKAVEQHMLRQRIPFKGNQLLLKMNKPDGFDCPSCAWPDPVKPHMAEFCENGAKAVAWEATHKRTGPEFFEKHTVTELLEWSDHALEDQGRLTHPMRYNAASDKYEAVEWDQAIAEIGAELKAIDDPNDVEFYTSGRASNEAAFMFQLLGRLYGTNNFPDCSNMCHETTTVSLPMSLGVGKATTTLDDFDHADAVFIFGQNAGTNSPRMMGELFNLVHRGGKVVTFNPLREKALVKFANPQSPADMMRPNGTDISSQYYQLRIGGDIAAIQGMCKALIEADDEAQAHGEKPVLDHEFIEAHTHGFEAFVDYCRGLSWHTLEAHSGLGEHELRDAADTYRRSERVIACWGMGITQHRYGGDAIHQIINLLLLRGNIGKRGAGACPVRGHSNVQGDRTVGIFHKPTEEMLSGLDKAFDITCPREHGHDVALCCEAILRGDVKAFVGLGGNFFRAIADQERVMAATLDKLDLTVQISTKLNRSHLIHGKKAYILPCLGKTERDVKAGLPQASTVEDGMCMVHASTGELEPASSRLRSEVTIISDIARATLPVYPKVDWAWMSEDHDRIRDKIEAVFPDVFTNFNERIKTPGGFHLYNAARERVWLTDTDRANFLFDAARLDSSMSAPEATHFQLLTTRGHDQFNTTVYSLDDRYRDIYGTRMVAMMNPDDMAKYGLEAGNKIAFSTVAEDGIARRVAGFQVVPYDIPSGCIASYYPETNPLIPIGYRDERSNTIAGKSVPVTIELMDTQEIEKQTGLLATG